MGILQTIGKWGNKISKPAVQDLPDGVTRDKKLLMYRRVRQEQLESVEKQRLKKDIREFERQRQAKEVWGFKNYAEQPKQGYFNPGRKVVGESYFSMSTMTGKHVKKGKYLNNPK